MACQLLYNGLLCFFKIKHAGTIDMRIRRQDPDVCTHTSQYALQNSEIERRPAIESTDGTDGKLDCSSRPGLLPSLAGGTSAGPALMSA